MLQGQYLGLLHRASYRIKYYTHRLPPVERFDGSNRFLGTSEHSVYGGPDLKRLLIAHNSEGPGHYAAMTRIIDFHTKNRARYTCDLDVAGHTIELRDLGSGKTVASDIENVIEDLAERGYSADRFSIRYQNSSGSWAQVLTANSAFRGLVPA